ncbi:MAG: hypothetical protein IMZ69_11860 [Spirochaetes bacterium]|nr:hypothetical protein [Spirochaetota bacterium]
MPFSSCRGLLSLPSGASPERIRSATRPTCEGDARQSLVESPIRAAVVPPAIVVVRAL